MNDLRDLLDQAETVLRRQPPDAEHSHLACLRRDVLALRAQLDRVDTDEERLGSAAHRLVAEARSIAARRDETDRRLPADTLAATVDRAVTAPAPDHSQPWRFTVRTGLLEVRLDHDRLRSASAPRSRSARVACGAALYNLRLAFAVELEHPAAVTLLPEAADPDLLADLRAGTHRAPTPRQRRLYAAIDRRPADGYAPTDGAAVDWSQRSALVAAANTEGCWLDPVTEPDRRADLCALVDEADTVLRHDPAYRDELARWTPGVQPPQPDPTAGDALLAVLGGAADTPLDHLAVGQALQSVLLTATSLDLAASLYSQPIEVPASQHRLRTMIGRLGTPYLVLRIGPPTRTDRAATGRVG